MEPYVPPEPKRSAFHCPFCGAYSEQTWGNAAWTGQPRMLITGFLFARCTHCLEYTYWHNETLVFPSVMTAPPPNPDLPSNVRVDYEEARSIVNASPRGAAALLRLAIQKLCKELGEPGKDLNTDIGNLLRKGLSPRLQQALDIVRVIGNEAVHPGQIDLRDDVATATRLFGLVNLIAEQTISHTKHIEEFYQQLPQSKLDQIAKRDGTTNDQ